MASQHFQTATRETTEDLSKGLEINNDNITMEEKQRLTRFLRQWKDIFSKGLTDLGNCDLVNHEIKLTDDVQIKESPRRIPPALFQEV